MVVKIVLLYLAVINLAAFCVYGFDKWVARRNGNSPSGAQMRRISEAALFRWAWLGGALGAFLGMKVWRHKTKHWYFVWGIPAICVIEIALLACLFWRF